MALVLRLAVLLLRFGLLDLTGRAWLACADPDVEGDLKFVPHRGFINGGAANSMPPSEMTIEEAKFACTMSSTCAGFTFQGSKNSRRQHVTWLKDTWEFWEDPNWTSFKKVQGNSLHPKALLNATGLAKVARSRPRYDPRHETTRLREIRGVAYGPVPRLDDDDEAMFPDHFVMGRFYRGQWASDGRNDIGLLKQLGANAVLLRGRGPWHKPWSSSDTTPLCRFRWYRFVPTKSRVRWNGIGITEFHFRNHQGDVSLSGAKANVMYPWWNNRDEGPEKAIDGKLDTQWHDVFRQAILIEFPNEVEVDSFSFTTGPDRPSDDPLRWQMQGSRDNKIWVLLHDQDTDYETPKERRKQTEWFSWGNDDCRKQHRGVFDSTGFLDNANSVGMKVIVGIPDHPFFMAHKACAVNKTDLDCYRIMKRHYSNKMQTGFTVWKAKKQDYHPAVDTVVLMNKPEKKLKSASGKGVQENYMRAIISAFDGILAAEASFGIDPLLGHTRFSVTFDYTACPTCKSFLELGKIGCCVPCGHGLAPCAQYGEVGRRMACTKSQITHGTDTCPVLAQILDLHNAMKNPESVGYTPMLKDPSLFEVYQERWTHSFHSYLPFSLIRDQVLNKYKKLAERFDIRRGGEEKSDKLMPIFIGEYHSVNSHNPASFQNEISSAMDYARNPSNPFIGLNIYTFQVPEEDNKCDETEWELFKSGKLKANPCPHRSDGIFSLGDVKAGETARVPLLTGDTEEEENWKSVPIFCLKPALPGKLKAVAAVYGGTVPDTSACRKGAAANPVLHCVANRSAKQGRVTKEASYACEKLRGKYKCSEMPAQCAQGYAYGDWALSIYVAHYASLHPNHRDRLCNANGAGVLTAFPPRPECTVNPASITPAEESGARLPSMPDQEASREDGGMWFSAFCLMVVCATLGCLFRLHKKRVQAHWASISTWGAGARAQQVTRPTVQQPLHEPAGEGAVRTSTLELADWS